MVRPGVALYGVNPIPGQSNPMRPVIELQARIAQVRTVPRGETVGYNAGWTAKRATRIAVVAVGYADGYLRAASASDLRAGRRSHRCRQALPAGRARLHGSDWRSTSPICPRTPRRRGDLATLIGDEITRRRRGQGRRHHRL